MTYFPSLLSRCMSNTKHMISITPVSSRYSRSSTTAYRNKEGLTLTCQIEGYTLEDLSVELQGSILEIKAPGLSPPEDAKLLRKEFDMGPLEVRYHVGSGYDIDRAQAELSGTHLKIFLPVLQAERRRIEIQQTK